MIASSTDPHQKVRAEHLRRDAYLYIRQSTIQQVFHNTESTQRQYALKQRAIALGWPAEHVIVIDGDQGHSGASAVDREGFQKLVADVGLGHAGIVLGLEVSRLARNCADWYRLLEICGMTDTLIMDEEGLYDPASFNDRLLLGLKGTMSEAELYMIRARLQGGIRNKALRGELKMGLPVGLVYDSQGRVVLDPDRQVRDAVSTFFQVYQREGSAWGVVKHFTRNGLNFPRRIRGGINKGQLAWGPLTHSRALQMLRNPRYAGAYAFGRTRTCKRPDGKRGYVAKPQEQWHSLIPDAHPGYITWLQYQDNLRSLRACAQAYGSDRRKGPPGEGPALLQGLVVCGRCGVRMTVRYHHVERGQVADYVCQREGIAHGHSICQSVPGAGIDQAVGELLLRMVQPVTLELAFAVQAELQARLDEVDHMRRQQVQRAQYEADLARSRFMQVDPRNRLVADALEADWNDKLRTLSAAQQQYDQQRQKDRADLDETARQRVLALARDLPKLWADPRTSAQDRKRMVRLLIEDVTLVKDAEIRVQIRFKGGTTDSLVLPIPLRAWQLRRTEADIVSEVDRLLNTHTESQIADELNRRGRRSGTNQAFTPGIVSNIRRAYRLRTRRDRLREAGLLTLAEMAQQLAVNPKTARIWCRHGLLIGHPYNRSNECLYEPVGANAPTKQQGVKLTSRSPVRQLIPQAANEVHDEA